MKLAIFGATGGTGHHLAEQALDAGHEVIALVRNPAKLSIRHERLSVVHGDVLDPAKVAETVRGSHAVLCTVVGPMLDPGPAVSVGTQHIVDAMSQHGVRRIVAVSALGIGDSRSQMPLLFRLLMSLLRSYMIAKERQESVLRESGLDWTIIRPGRLTSGPKTGTYRFGQDRSIRLKLSAGVSRADLADFMLKQLASDEFLHRTPAIVGS